ncbi:MAG TPA: hypothetical protein VFG54_03895 [Prolixibacteraceae bacterium]|nr:hypothetical protein [Prolixibacteraceae bacterium]
MKSYKYLRVNSQGWIDSVKANECRTAWNDLHWFFTGGETVIRALRSKKRATPRQDRSFVSSV